jgi:septal ring factor EnvC (AmiA/AmiB activator)
VTPGPAHSDLRKKLKAITNVSYVHKNYYCPKIKQIIMICSLSLSQERDKALEEVGSCKKELKIKSEKIDSLMAELEKERKKNAELASELEQVEDHRGRLLDKVERLHADKHNLEARFAEL